MKLNLHGVQAHLQGAAEASLIASLVLQLQAFDQCSYVGAKPKKVRYVANCLVHKSLIKLQ